MEIVLATRNKKKIEEISRIMRDFPITILTLRNFPNCPDVAEDRDTFEGNARKKAVEIAVCTGIPSLADDSGLEVDALEGAPGVYSARYASCAGEVNDAKNNDKLLQELHNVAEAKRSARFVCCLALAFPDGDVKTFFGISPGKISLEPRGTNGFGYNPIFIPEGHTRTFAEMSGEEKDRLSHRGKALRKLREYINYKYGHS